MKAKAVVFTDKNKVAFQEVEIPEPGNDQVLIDAEYSWISVGTESSFLRGERITGETVYKDGDPLPFPHVPGYQKVGVVKKVGPGITDLSVGDYVFATVSEVSNMHFSSGGHISPALTHTNQVWKLPANSNPIAYSGLVLTQVGFNCGMRAPISMGDVALVIGDGLVGQWAAQTLQHRGATVIVLGRHNERLQFLPESIHGVNGYDHSIKEILKKYEGIQVVVDSVGSLDTFYELLPLMKHNSHFVSAGFLGAAGKIDIQDLRAKEITLHCPSGWHKTRMDETIKWIEAGFLKTEELITHQFYADQAVGAWKMIGSKNESYLGIVLKWD